MAGFRKKSVIDKRLKKLEKELAKVDSVLKAKSASQLLKSATPNPSRTAKRPLQAKPPAPVQRTAPPPAPAKDLFPQSKHVPSPAPSNTSPINKWIKDLPTDPQNSGREKFANYFMASHFQNLRPLRQENRIVRNKAIVMIVMIVLGIVWLIYFLN